VELRSLNAAQDDVVPLDVAEQSLKRMLLGSLYLLFRHEPMPGQKAPKKIIVYEGAHGPAMSDRGFKDGRRG
jgi:hypothetical protein